MKDYQKAMVPVYLGMIGTLLLLIIAYSIYPPSLVIVTFGTLQLLLWIFTVTFGASIIWISIYLNPRTHHYMEAMKEFDRNYVFVPEEVA